MEPRSIVFTEPWLILQSAVYLPVALCCLNTAFPSDVSILSHLWLCSRGLLTFVLLHSTQLQWCIIPSAAVFYKCFFSDRISQVCCMQHLYCSWNFSLPQCHCPQWVQTVLKTTVQLDLGTYIHIFFLQDKERSYTLEASRMQKKALGNVR
jgi:hypothetical protein